MLLLFSVLLGCVITTTQALTQQPTSKRAPPRTLEVVDAVPEAVASVHTDAMSRRNALASMAAVGLVLAMPTTSNAAVEKELSSTAAAVTSTSTTTAEAAVIDWQGVFQKASKKALGGGKAGASAAVVQVFSLMWLRTSMNRQYRYGGDLKSSLKALWEEGGIPRLYQGLPFALVQGPLTRFGDTAANVGIIALLDTIPQTQSLPLPLKTAAGSIAAGAWRIILMPIDASKTAMQVEGAEGLQKLWKLATVEGPSVMYQGAVAQAAATAVGHFPWYLTYNFLNEQIPTVSSSDDLLLSLARSALLGLCSSCVSDVCSNSLRVIKTTKQTARLGSSEDGLNNMTDEAVKDLSYPDIVKMIIEQDGIKGLLGRGLQTRLLTNAIQGAVFSVLWRYFQQA